jgi:tRNA A-37 threonylcarbamoyl transferase component Bud32
MIEFPIPTPLASFAPTISTRTSDNHNANLGIESSTLYIFIPVGAVVLGMILSLSYFLFRHKFDLSRTRSYEKNTIQFIQKKQTKQIHCVCFLPSPLHLLLLLPPSCLDCSPQEPDRQTNLEAGMESLKKARWVIHPSQLTIPVAPNLGSGGYGVVKRGIFRDGRRKYDVAVKILLDRHVNSEEFRRVLIREAALMVELRSPYIVEVYGLCDSKMLVLELMNYGSLYTLLETVEPSSFPLSLRIQLMIDSIRGIEYLHESDVIHADMKSLNILLCTEGGSLKAKISDFGLSRIVMGDTCESTNTNQISIRWAAPEMLQDRPKISKSIDIYAFGVVMWEILALKRPYAEMNLAPLIQRVTTGGREPMPAETPPLIGDLISLCWAQFPDQRPKAAYVRESLTSFQQTFDTVGESISEFASPL